MLVRWLVFAYPGSEESRSQDASSWVSLQVSVALSCCKFPTSAPGSDMCCLEVLANKIGPCVMLLFSSVVHCVDYSQHCLALLSLLILFCCWPWYCSSSSKAGVEVEIVPCDWRRRGAWHHLPLETWRGRDLGYLGKQDLPSISHCLAHSQACMALVR